MPLRLRLTSLLVAILAACQAPVPQAPTPPPPVPTTIPSAVPTTIPSAMPTTIPSAVPSPTAPPVGTSRVDTLNAANAAFAKGDVASAAGLYERVLNTPPTGEPPATTSAINQFAHFRAIVALLVAGREDDAHAHVQALQQLDAAAPLARLANQLWDQYGMVGQLRGACAQLQPQITSQAGPTLSALQTLGVTVDAATLCSVPPS
jgi:hypothetical protein